MLLIFRCSNKYKQNSYLCLNICQKQTNRIIVEKEERKLPSIVIDIAAQLPHQTIIMKQNYMPVKGK